MKISRSSILASLAFLFCAPQVDAITADDLARYLEVSSYTTIVGLSPGSFVAEVYEIKDGEVAGLVVEGDRRWSKKAEPSLTIMTGTEGGKYRIVVAYEDGVTVSAVTTLQKFSHVISPSLPPRIEAGDYILFGKPKDAAAKRIDAISSYSSGFLLRVRANPF